MWLSIYSSGIEVYINSETAVGEGRGRRIQELSTVNSRYKRTVGPGGVTNICIYRENVKYMIKWANEATNRY